MPAIFAAEFGNLADCIMNPIPKHIHQVWLGSAPIPADQKSYMEKLKELRSYPNGWSYDLWTDDRLGELGLRPADLKFGTHAANSNLVRIVAVYLHGGIYLDTDCELIGDLGQLRKHSAWAAQQVDGLICNACFGAHKAHPWLLWQILNYQECTKDDAGCGPRTMTRAPREYLTLIDPRICYPFSWDTPDEKRAADPHSIIVHHWAKSWLKPAP